MKIDVAAAVFTGTLRMAMSKGTIKTPPPIPNIPATKPTARPIITPPQIRRPAAIGLTAAVGFPEKSIRSAAMKITPARIPVKVRTSTAPATQAPAGAATDEERISGMPIWTSTIFFWK